MEFILIVLVVVSSSLAEPLLKVHWENFKRPYIPHRRVVEEGWCFGYEADVLRFSTHLAKFEFNIEPREIVADTKLVKLGYGKHYKNVNEESIRLKIFSKNMDKIAAHNKLFEQGLVSYRMGLNQFADMTSEEFIDYLNMSGPRPPMNISEDAYVAPDDVELPESIDYRKLNAVNPVKNQGSCGSCWAFSNVAALESINYLKTGQLLSLSEQNLVDCSWEYGNEGCYGGLMVFGYDYIRDYGVETEDNYPYTGENGKCKFLRSNSALKIAGYRPIPRGNELALKAAVALVGPVAVGVDASEWQFYSSGIFTSHKTIFVLSHGVVVIGYGVENGEEYWIVRNSWGASWGENGYIRVARNKNNQLGISDQACFPYL